MYHETMCFRKVRHQSGASLKVIRVGNVGIIVTARKILFLHVCVTLPTEGGARGRGSMHGQGACLARGACMAGGGVHGRGACVVCTPPWVGYYEIRSVNALAVRILLECILV